jgi:AraC-like DNA-binding protein
LGGYDLTFGGLADEARFELGQSLLHKDRPISLIASALGYADASAFIKAFKRWSGTTPGRWRASQIHGRSQRGPLDWL